MRGPFATKARARSGKKIPEDAKIFRRSRWKIPLCVASKFKEIQMSGKTVTRASISAEAAQTLIAAAMRKATEMGVPMAIAVCDESGVLKAFARMDGAALLAVNIAQDKAYTAVSFGISTDAWFDFIKDDPPLLHGIVKTDRLTVFGGGYPVKAGKAVIGGIGVSGGHYHQDMQVAQAAVAALG